MKRILWSLLLLGALVVGGCGYSKSLPGTETVTDGTTSGVVPTGVVSYTVPNNGDTGIVNNSTVYIVFTQSLNVQTANNPSYFPVICGSASEVVSVVYDSASKTINITPSDGAWTDSSVCMVTAKVTSLRNSSGAILGTSDFSFSFTTASGGGGTVPATTPLGVDFTVPIDNATGVTASDPFYMIFNKTLNPLTVTTTSFAVACGSTTTQTPLSDITVAYNSANKAVVVNPPPAGWPGGQVCKVTARKSYVKDSANVALTSDLTFTFSTGAGGTVGTTALAVDYAIPIPPANQIAINSALTFVFNKSLNAVTVVPTAFTASCNGQAVNGYSVTNNAASKSIQLTPPPAGWGNGVLCDVTIKKNSLWAADSQNMTADYTYSFSTITTTGIAVNRLALSADKYSVKSTGTDQAVVTVKALDANGATIPDVTIALSTNRGELSASTVKTDTTGKATFTFNADTTRANGVATITASSGVVTPVSLPMTITGTTLVMTANKSITKTGLLDDITLIGTLKDADNIPIILSDVSIVSALGNTLKNTATGVSGSSITAKTDGSGNFSLTYSAANTGKDTITAAGFGAIAIANLTVTNATFAFTSPLPDTVVNCNATKQLTVHWTNDLGVAVVGPVTFSATNGFFGGFRSQAVATNASGDATVTYTASGIASPDVITATAIDTTTNPDTTLQTILPLDIRANDPTQLFVQATSTVIGIRTPGNVPISTIIATILDPVGNPVAGQIVNFSLVKGAGGGEYLSPPSALTDSAGQAKTTFYSGTAASLQNGVTVRASIDTPSLSDTVNLTISGTAASIIFGSTNKIGVVTVDNYPVAYELPVSILVTDINGGPIANQPVSIGIYPKAFRTGQAFAPTATDPWTWVTTAIFTNEDVNRNAILDSSEDGAAGICGPGIIFGSACVAIGTGNDVFYHNGTEDQIAEMSAVKDVPLLNNGRLDPRNVATVPLEVITDDNGLALVKIIYPKSYCNWIDTELSATTQVSGTETQAVFVTRVNCMADDEPYSSSPFGY